MNHLRKIAATGAFVVAFAAAVGLTIFFTSRPRPAPPVESPTVVNKSATVYFEVEQAVVDFKQKQTHTTLRLEPLPDGTLPERLWVWTNYAPPMGVAERATLNGKPSNAAQALWQSWTTSPIEVSVAGRRRLEVVAACPMCDERPKGKPTYYARVSVSVAPPARETIENGMSSFNTSNPMPVIVQGVDDTRPQGGRR